MADFGLSHQLFEREYYSSKDHKAKLPIKWMALESLEDFVFTAKSDVVRSVTLSFVCMYDWFVSPFCGHYWLMWLTSATRLPMEMLRIIGTGFFTGKLPVLMFNQQL